MKNITLKVDDTTYHRARIRAAETGTSVSAMVRNFLNSKDCVTADKEPQRIEALKSLFNLAEKQAEYNTKPVNPFKRDEIYDQSLR